LEKIFYGGRDITALNNDFINDSRIIKKNNILVFAMILASLILISSSSIGGVSAVAVNDTHPPVISSVDPANNAVSISTSKVVKITFNETVKKGNMWIEFKTSNGKSVQFTSNLTGKTLYLKPKSQLAHNTGYILVLHSGSVNDLAGNALAVYSTKFTTIQTTKTYSANWVSFKYPSTYNIYTDTENGSKYINGVRGYAMISPEFGLSIIPNPMGMSDQDARNSIYNVQFPSGYKIISKQIYTINSNKVYGMVYTINNKNEYPVIMKTKELDIVKNHKTYILYFTAMDKSFANQQIDFNIISQSFKIQ